MLDFERICVGDVVHEDGSPVTVRPGIGRMFYSPTGGLEYDRDTWSVEARRELLEMLADDIYEQASEGEIGRRGGGMTANQFLYERGGTWLQMSPAERERAFPAGTVMYGHAERVEARKAKAAAARAERERANAARRGRRESSEQTVMETGLRVRRVSV